MTLPVWPADLPPPLRRGYQGSLLENRLRRSGQGGPPRFERLTSARTRELSLQIVTDRVGKSLFDRFHAETTADGALPFAMPDPVSDGWPLLTPGGDALLAPDGEPLTNAATLLCLFGEALPRDTLQGRDFTITFSVTVLP